MSKMEDDDLYTYAKGATLETLEPLSSITLPYLLTPLYAHQQLALKWIQHQETTHAAGILADGPGLGKTLSMLTAWCSSKEKGRTLLICPHGVLVTQWMSECKKHIKKDELQMGIYNGLPSHCNADDARQYVDVMQDWDVTITTLKCLSTEFRYWQAEKAERAQERYMAPLFHVDWYRIAVDEVQEVEGMASLAAQLLVHLPSVQRWGISGTPISRGLKDLIGLAQFLQLPPYADPSWWKIRLNTCDQKDIQIFIQKVMWRTAYSVVQCHLNLPIQHDLPITYLDVTAMEYAFYRPRLHTYVQHIVKKFNAFENNQDVVKRSDLVKLASDAVIRDLCQSANHPLLVSTSSKKRKNKNEGAVETILSDTVLSSSVNNYGNVMNSQLNSLVLLSLQLGLEEQYNMTSLLKTPCRAYLPESMYYFVKQLPSSTITWTTKLKLLLYLEFHNDLHDLSPITAREKYNLQSNSEWIILDFPLHRPAFPDLVYTILYERTGLYRLIPVLWEQVLAFLGPADFQYQREIICKRHVDSYYQSFFVLSKASSVQYTSWKDAEEKKDVRGDSDDISSNLRGRFMHNLHTVSYSSPTSVTTVLDEFASLSPTEIKDRVGLSEKELWTAVKANEIMTTIAIMLQGLYTKLIARVHDLHESLLETSLALERDKSENNVLVAIHKKCDHSIRNLNKVRLAGREERWAKRDLALGQGRGQTIVLDRTVCFHCRDMDRLDEITDMLTCGGSDSMLTRIVRIVFPELLDTIAIIKSLNVAGRQTLVALSVYLTRFHMVSDLRKEIVTVGLRQAWRAQALYRNYNLVSKASTFRRWKILYAEYIDTTRNFDHCKKLLDVIQDLRTSESSLRCDHCSSGITQEAKVLLCSHCLCKTCTLSCDSKQCCVCLEVQPTMITKMPRLCIDNPVQMVHGVELTLGMGSKIDAMVVDIVRIVMDPSSLYVKCLVFSQYPNALDMLLNLLLKNGVRCGKVKSKEDVKEIRKLTTLGTIDVLLLPLKGMNHGLNLPQAQHIFLMEPCLQVALEKQAVARVRRLNQVKETYVHRYVVNSTVERPISDLLSTRGDHLTKHDMYELFTNILE